MWDVLILNCRQDRRSHHGAGLSRWKSTNAVSTEMGVALARHVAREWLVNSLEQGSDLATDVLEGLALFSNYRILVPTDMREPIPSPLSVGIGLKTREVDSLALKFFNRLEGDRSQTLIVEDDLARRGDPRNLGRVAFVGERVLHWCELNEAADAAVDLLHDASAGYPLNAFVAAGSPEQLGLSAQASLLKSDLRVIRRRISTVLVGVLDGETYLIASRPSSD
jgi:hypothetical protein